VTAGNAPVALNPEREEQARNWLLLCLIILLAFGLVIVFSAGYVRGLFQGGGARFGLAFAQLCYMLLGGVALLITYSLPRRILRRMSLPLLVVSLLLLCLVWVPGVGREVRGGTRWIALGPLTLQPSELAKIALILWLSNVLSVRTANGRSRLHAGVPFAVIFLFSGLVLIQPHLGSAVMITASGVAVMYLAGVRLSKLLAGCLIALTLGALAVGGTWLARPDTWGKKWEAKWERIASFYSEGGVEADRYGGGYQSFQSMLAIASGGWAGKGIGASRAKFNYLPDGHTDFIYAILGEELGFWACLLVLVCFLGLMAKGFSLGQQAKDRFAGLLICGLSVSLGLQALVNIGMATAWLPAIGLPLPFVSYGGSSLLVSLAAIGLMLGASHFEPEGERNWRRT